MIDKLSITNFMTFKKLEISTLKRVNLIGGKNNSGKTTLLDAIRILESSGDSSVVNNILELRGAFRKNVKKSYDALYNRKIGKNLKANFKINDFILYKNENNNSSRYYHLIREDRIIVEAMIDSDRPNDAVVYVPFQSDIRKLNELWDEIVLTPREDDVHKILKETVEPNLVRFDVGHSKVRVRLENTDKPVPIGTLGDGVQRILLIALSLANAKNSILLIDEIELGLHYSVLEKLWQMIFKYAQEWNIQVFVTTHSQDAIKTFHYVASDDKYINDAEYIRLQISRKGENEAIIFDGDRLKDSLELQLEIR